MSVQDWPDVSNKCDPSKNSVHLSKMLSWAYLLLLLPGLAFAWSKSKFIIHFYNILYYPEVSGGKGKAIFSLNTTQRDRRSCLPHVRFGMYFFVKQ